MIDYPWLYSNMSQKNTAHNLGPFRVDEIVNVEIIEKFQFLWQFIKKWQILPSYLQLSSKVLGQLSLMPVQVLLSLCRFSFPIVLVNHQAKVFFIWQHVCLARVRSPLSNIPLYFPALLCLSLLWPCTLVFVALTTRWAVCFLWSGLEGKCLWTCCQSVAELLIFLMFFWLKGCQQDTEHSKPLEL